MIVKKINSIYTTRCEGHVYIAADTQYLGKVKSYNNLFSRFFARLFGRSMKVNFDGKLRSVNKQSYTNLIQSIAKIDKIKDIQQFHDFKPIAEEASLPQNQFKMRDFISSNHRAKLFRKLAFAIRGGDTQKALSMIGKGADLDTKYYDRSGQSLSFNCDSEGLNRESRYEFTVFHASPILQAAKVGNMKICQALKDAGATLSSFGTQNTFKREIKGVERRLETVPVAHVVPHHHHVRGPRGRVHHHVSHHVEVRPEVRERMIVYTEDSRSDNERYEMDAESLRLKRHEMTMHYYNGNVN